MATKLSHKNDDDLNLSSPDISNSSAVGLNGNDTDSACEEDIFDDEIKEVLGDEPESVIPQHVLDLADHALAKLPPRWRNWITRVISGLTLISGFSFLISLGPIGLFFLTYLVEFSSYNEFLKLGQKICGVREKYMTKWCWMVFFVFHWIIISSGEISHNLNCLPILEKIVKYKVFVGFSLYVGLLVFFVLNTQLHDRHYMRRYALFAWSHIWSIFFTIPAFLLNKATMSGLIWYVMPMSLITINDIGAYMVGFFGGKTPLIKLSPKKTKEGFIGGGIITLILGTILTNSLVKSSYLICPVQSNPYFLENLIQHGEITDLFSVIDCQPKMVFQTSIITFGRFSFSYSPFVVHGFLVSLFASILGPFGGFFSLRIETCM